MWYNPLELQEPDIVDAIASLCRDSERYEFTNMLSWYDITRDNWAEAFKFFDTDMNGDGIPDYIQGLNRGINPETGDPWNLMSGVPPFSYDEAVERKDELVRRWNTDNYQRERIKRYASLDQQLAALFDDIKDGKFGEDAKKGRFAFLNQQVKDQLPKPE
ncbi:hypothetical protein Sn110110_049 [Cyanophage S-RIM14]|uniref:Uncharacterized protein n=1 Tax=Cyanophage S-RIM14 TaxID=1278423 RepID=A0A1D7SKU8_9CAUD|nr:hypothetical protein Sn110110_049 [Cyanophage S-RIM14]